MDLSKNYISMFYVIGYAIIFFYNVHEISCFGELSWESRIMETYLTHDEVSLMDCVSKCEVSDGCCSINYSRHLLLCELNYKTKESGTLYSNEDRNGFINSNIASWPNKAKPSCPGTSCGPNKQCSQTTGACLVIDCGKAPNGPPKSLLHHYGHHVVGNEVVYTCEQGHNMFQGTKILEANRIVARCTETGEWEIDEFTCKACDVPIDCQDIKRYFSSISGVYTIKPKASEFHVDVYCDMGLREEEAWTIFQRRIDGSVNFFNDWETYKNGFGNISGEYWLGNDLIHKITSQNRYRLRVDLGDFSGKTKFAEYGTFSIEDEGSKYKLNVAFYTGTAGDALQFHNSRPFSTRDKDNDAHSRDNCAMDYHAGWWFKNCHAANLNGQYFSTSYKSTRSKVYGIVWKEWLWPSTLKTSTMKIARNIYELPDAENCGDVKALSKEPRSGVYRISPGGGAINYFVYCKFEQTHAWTVIQRRINGSENFNRQPEEYIHGFGNFHGEFWLGTATLHDITDEESYILRVEVVDFCNMTWFAEYSHFQVGNQNTNYKLSISGYSGTAGDTFGLKNDLPFTTVSTASCPIHYTGAWWYRGCPFPNLNSAYNKTNSSGIMWNNWKGEKHGLKGTTMKIRL